MATLENRKHNSICDKDEETQKETSKHNDRVYCNDKGANQDPFKTLERRFSKVHDIEKTKKRNLRKTFLQKMKSLYLA